MKTPQPSVTAPDIAKPLGPTSMEMLNRECFCISLDTEALRKALASEIGEPGLIDLIQQRCPHLFSARPVFLSHAHVARMAELVRATESVVAMPTYRADVLRHSPPIARHDLGGAKGPDSPMAMPPKGGNPGLTERDLATLVDYMRSTFKP
jgi:hypothetical protein